MQKIFNYRTQHLTKEIRKKHIPNNDAFKMSVNNSSTNKYSSNKKYNFR